MMKYTRPLVGLSAAAAVCAIALPSQAATSKTLYFDTQVASGTSGCTPTYVLTPAQPSGGACGGFTVGYMGTTAEKASEVYSLIAGSAKGKINATKHLTGTVYVSTTPPVGFSAGPAATPDSMGGPIGADITFSINGVTVGKATGSDVVAPNAPLAIKVDIALPKSLNRKAVKSVQADVEFTGGTGVSIVNDSGSAMSSIVLPLR